MAQISSISYDYKGQIQVWYNDTDSSVDYFNFYTLTQKQAIDWIRKDGKDVIVGEIVNDMYPDNMRKGKKAFARIERETGKKIELRISNGTVEKIQTENYQDWPKAGIASDPTEGE